MTLSTHDLSTQTDMGYTPLMLFQ